MSSERSCLQILGSLPVEVMEVLEVMEVMEVLEVMEVMEVLEDLEAMRRHVRLVGGHLIDGLPDGNDGPGEGVT